MEKDWVYMEGEAPYMIAITVLTNLTFFPCIWVLYKQSRHLECFLGVFTMVTSFMYHLADSLNQDVFLNEGDWHRLDNVGAITGFCTLLMYLGGMPRAPHLMLSYLFLGLNMILQECCAWDERYTIAPLLTAACVGVIYAVMHPRSDRFRWTPLKKGLLWLAAAVVCFVKGLDEHQDFLRIWHGLWHLTVGASGYYMWQTVPQLGDLDFVGDVASNSKLV